VPRRPIASIAKRLRSTDRMQTQFLDRSSYRLAGVQIVNFTCEVSATAIKSQLGGHNTQSAALRREVVRTSPSQYTPSSAENHEAEEEILETAKNIWSIAKPYPRLRISRCAR
jgi:hypothetical protein